LSGLKEGGEPMETVISSPSRQVRMGDGLPTVIIGERINPTGKKWLQEALKAGDLDVVRREATAQAEAGADVLDIHVGGFGLDEADLLPRAVQAVLQAVDLPLCLDCTDPRALEAALEVYPGKALVNSVTGEERSLSEILPVVKRHGAAVVGLVQDDEGIPRDADRRVEIARRIVERAGEEGIPLEDVVIDCLVFSVGADATSGAAVLEAVSRVRCELGVNVVLGLSNVSFGLPDRGLVNGVFAAMAVLAGATCLIADAAAVRHYVLAAVLVMGKDRHARRFLADYRRRAGKPTG